MNPEHPDDFHCCELCGRHVYPEERPTESPRRHARYQKPRRLNDVVAYRLVRWFALDEVDMLYVFTRDKLEAGALVYQLDGPYTSGDIDVRAVTCAELERMKAP